MKLKDGFILRSVAGETVVLPTGGVTDFDMMITLNDTGKFLWELLEQDQTVESLAQALVENYEVDIERATADVIKYLEPLKPIQAIID